MTRKKRIDPKLASLLEKQSALADQAAKDYTRLKRAFNRYNKVRMRLAATLRSILRREQEIVAERQAIQVEREVNGE